MGFAEAQELAVHVHFDAKYRVQNIAELFGPIDDDLEETRSEERRGTYRRADLLKMHAYRDAIRRSEGAYVIYPGATSTPTAFKGFHEILPGLGAFALKPGGDGQPAGIQHLSRFLDEVIAHLPSVRGMVVDKDQEGRSIYEVHGPAAQVQAAANRHYQALQKELGNKNPPALYDAQLVDWDDDDER